MERKGLTKSCLNYNTILQLDPFHRRQEKWSETACTQTFMALYQDPLVCPGHTALEDTRREKILDVLGNLLLPVRQSLEGNSGTPVLPHQITPAPPPETDPQHSFSGSQYMDSGTPYHKHKSSHH